MPHRQRWRSLVPGLAIILALVLASAAVLRYGRMIALHGDSFRLYVTMADARNVMSGTEVWLDGQKVGIVTGIDFAPPSADTLHRVVAVLDVLEEDRRFIRRDAVAQLQPGGTLVAPPVIYLADGTPTAPAVRDGDTLRATPGKDLEQITSRAAVASREFPAIIANVKLLAGQLRGAQGTLGALGVEGMPPAMNEAGRRVTALHADLTTPRGTVGLALSGRQGSLGDRARVVMARADSVRTLLASGRGSLGRFRRDSSLVREMTDIRNEASIVQALLANPVGTVGRAGADSAIVRGLSDAQRSMAALMADLRRHPLRYVQF